MIDIREKIEEYLNINDIKIEYFKEYPHVFRLLTNNSKYIGKILDKSRLLCDDINSLFSLLSQNCYLEVPVLIDKKYGIDLDTKFIVFYNILDEIKENPSSKWWANSLSSIHLLNSSENNKKYFKTTFYDETITLFNLAREKLDYDILNYFEYILNNSNLDIDYKDIKYVLCHNDPYNLNVMKSGDNLKLIDLDCVGLSPSEYDIERLLINEIINSDSNNFENFLHKFLEKYEEETNYRVNLSLLKKIFLLDLIRVYSWLILVTNTEGRADKNRQIFQLELRNKSIRDERINNFIKKL